jgi:hypothetical protein
MTEREPTTTVRITLREIYDTLLELKTIVSQHPERIDDHEKRIRDLEFKVWSFSGIASIIAVIVGIVINTIS